MDTHVKEGQLYVQHQKFGKKWKKNWFVLYPASQNGIARLEFFDSSSAGTVGGGGGSVSGANEKTRKLDKKIIRLSECISILPTLMETCPKDNMAAFCVETNDKTHVFAAEKGVAKDWMDTMCDIAFQGGSGTSAGDSNVGKKDMQMSENLIYFSREEVSEFWVCIQRTEASERCVLSGNYWLKAEGDVLILKDPKTKRNILVWPYKLLRRYGRDRVMFSFEAGRRCDSGPGNFTFDTKQGNEIFQLVDQAIQSQKALTEDHHPTGTTNFESDWPTSLQHLRNVPPGGASMTAGSGDSSSSSSREADGDSGDSKPGSGDSVFGKREGGDGGGGGRVQVAGGGHKGRGLPEPPPTVVSLGGGSTPPMGRQGAAGVGKGPGPSSTHEHVGLYSEPADSVRLPLHTGDGLYSDPVDIIKAQNQTSSHSPIVPVPTPRLRPVGDEASGGSASGAVARDHHNHRKPPDLCLHLYDQITFELNQKTGALGLDGAGNALGAGRGGNSNRRPPGGKAEGSSSPPATRPEHIYDEPEGCAKGQNYGISIYDKARLEPHCLRRQEVDAPFNTEGSYSVPSHRKFSEFQSSSQLGQSYNALPPPPLSTRWLKPTKAPKPGKKKQANLASNVNNNNNIIISGGEGTSELYSKVSKHKAPPSYSRCSQNTHHQAPVQSPDIIYDNLGNI